MTSAPWGCCIDSCMLCRYPWGLCLPHTTWQWLGCWLWGTGMREEWLKQHSADFGGHPQLQNSVSLYHTSHRIVEYNESSPSFYLKLSCSFLSGKAVGSAPRSCSLPAVTESRNVLSCNGPRRIIEVNSAQHRTPQEPRENCPNTPWALSGWSCNHFPAEPIPVPSFLEKESFPVT